MGTFAKTLLPALAIAALLACSRTDDASRDRLKNGEAIYNDQCRGCHGARGEGGRGPVLRDIHLRYDEAKVVRIIDQRMPLGEPERCDGECPADVGAYVYHVLRGPIVCDVPVPLARGLRLLTRREYKATIEDLFGSSTAAPPTAPSSCGHTFVYDPQGRALKSVHVAGSFNGWPGTIAAGGWPLAQANGKWSLTKELPGGTHQYKLVLDESEWIVDPANPKTASNGLGGDNSVVDGGACANATAPSTSVDPTNGFPPETRPEGFPFDDHGPGRVVTSALMDEHVRAAGAIAKSADLKKLVTCDTTKREECTRSFVRDFGKRVFRRPLAPNEIDRFAKVGSTAADFDKGARAVIKALLASPSFVYRSELGQPKDGAFVLDPWETASALSYFFTGSMPDGELFAAAESGAIDIEKQARRLLASPRARVMVRTLAEQWLGAENVLSVTKDEGRYPLPPALRAAMVEETRRLVEHVVFDGSHSLDEIFTADYTFANGTLASHYGLGGATGDSWTRVKLDANRSGILGHGSILATTAHSDQSSPIRRGLFVRRRLLCQEFAPPPPNAGGVPKVDPNATTRERFAQHTANAQCHSCHQFIDDVGFGFERFDATGRVRDTEDGKPIDSRGDMNDVDGFGKGTHAPYTSLAELGRTLASSNAAKTCVARQAWRYARGHLDDDVCQVSFVEKRFTERGGDLRELLVAIAVDPAFVVRK